MREILFRAKRIDNSEWIKGYLWRGVDHAYIIPETVGVGYDDKTHFLSAYAIEIDYQTLCQFTGLTDKNCKRIWENDIVSCEHKKYSYDDSVVFPWFPDPKKYKRNYAVKFVNTGSGYEYRLRNKSIHFMLTGDVVYNQKIEVIGNVFDDKHLLDEKEGLNETAKRI